MDLTPSRETQLDAWPVVSSALFELSQTSEEVVSIVGYTGLNVDWNLTGKDNYSNSTRKRAYRPRVHSAYARLPISDRNVVLSKLILELARKYPSRSEQIRIALAEIGWSLKTSSESSQSTGQTVKSMKRNKELQRLLLLHVRDGKEPPEMANYSEHDQVYNSALLINDGYVDGHAIRGSDGAYASAVMIHLTSKGHDFLEGIKSEEPPLSHTDDMALSQSSGAHPTIPATAKLIFVSHCSSDKDVAEALVDLICFALNIRLANILCTSVDGAKLRGGDHTDTVLRAAICDTPAFLSILTPKAMASNYVLFELGARWGTNKSHIPLLAKGTNADVLKEPLKATNALNLNHTPDVLELVSNLGGVLAIQSQPPQSYIHKVNKLVATCAEMDTGTQLISGQTPPQQPQVGTPASSGKVSAQVQQVALMSSAARKLLMEAAGTVDGNVSKNRDAMHGEIVNVHTTSQDFYGDINDARTRALWVDAFNELVRAGCFASTPHEGIYTVTHNGYQMADILKRAESRK